MSDSSTVWNVGDTFTRDGDLAEHKVLETCADGLRVLVRRQGYGLARSFTYFMDARVSEGQSRVTMIVCEHCKYPHEGESCPNPACRVNVGEAAWYEAERVRAECAADLAFRQRMYALSFAPRRDSE